MKYKNIKTYNLIIEKLERIKQTANEKRTVVAGG